MEFNATFLVSIISFLVFMFIMNQILYAPLSKIVDEREKIIDDNYSDAKNYSDRADNINKELNEKLAETEDNSRKIIASKIEQYNNESKEKTNEAAKQASLEISEYKQALNEEKKHTEALLKNEISELAEQITSKVLGLDVKGTSSKAAKS